MCARLSCHIQAFGSAACWIAQVGVRACVRVWGRVCINTTAVHPALPHTAAYYYLYVDSDGQPLHGNRTYDLVFPAPPPATSGAFWPLQALGQDTWTLIFGPNPLNTVREGGKWQTETVGLRRARLAVGVGAGGEWCA